MILKEFSDFEIYDKCLIVHTISKILLEKISEKSDNSI